MIFIILASGIIFLSIWKFIFGGASSNDTGVKHINTESENFIMSENSKLLQKNVLSHLVQGESDTRIWCGIIEE